MPSRGCRREPIHISDYLDLNRNQTAILCCQPLFAPPDNRDLLAHRHKPGDTKLQAAVPGGCSAQEITAFDALLAGLALRRGNTAVPCLRAPSCHF